MQESKLYVVTRNDLSRSQQAVQAGHALAELLLSEDVAWNNGTLVYLKVNDESELKGLTERLGCGNIPFVGFIEPDRGDELTAIASVGSNEHFSTMRLL